MKWLSLLVATMGLMIGTGCNSVKAPIEGRMDPYGSSQINFADRDIQRQTAVGVPVPVRDDAGLLHVTVPIRAATNEQLIIDYRATFFDDTGTVISKTTWLTKHLSPNVFDEIKVNSYSPNAVQFRIDIREAR